MTPTLAVLIAAVIGSVALFFIWKNRARAKKSETEYVRETGGTVEDLSEQWDAPRELAKGGDSRITLETKGFRITAIGREIYAFYREPGWKKFNRPDGASSFFFKGNLVMETIAEGLEVKG